MDNIIVGMGETLWDVLPEGKKIGGAPANFAYNASQFGFTTFVVSAVGKDSLGDGILRNFEQKQLKMLIPQVDYPTGTVQVSLDNEGIPCYNIMENAAWDNIPFTPQLRELAERTSAVCFGSLAQRSDRSRATINSFLDTMPDGANRYKIFDINLRQHFYSKEIITDSLKRCNVLKINDEELSTVAKMFNLPQPDPASTCQSLLKEHGLAMVILTCGTKGSYVFSDEGVSFVETPSVTVADTVGAGDSFTGSFIAAILKGRRIADAHKIAVRVSAFVCTQNGAMPEYHESLKKLI